MPKLSSATFLVGLLFATFAMAQDLPGDPVKGRDLSRKLCSECHYVDRQWADLYVFEAPSFTDIARESDHTEMSLRVFFVSPHLRMPNIILEDTQKDDIISWILSLRKE